MRLRKQGLDYFPHDIDMSSDSKMQFVEALHGLAGYAVVNKLFELIYRNGYWMSWTKKEGILYAKQFGIGIDDLNSIVSSCVDEGIFDKKMFLSHSVLTSHGIQKRFSHAAKKRKGEGQISLYSISAEEKGISAEEKCINSAEMPINSDFGTQRIEKNRIEYPPKSNPRKFESDSSEYKAAEYLLTKIKAHSPGIKTPNMQKWAKEFDGIMRIDKRDKGELRKVIDFSTSDHFWRKNILSAGKLREKYDQLLLNMSSSKSPPGKRPVELVETVSDDDPKYKEFLDQVEKAKHGNVTN